MSIDQAQVGKIVAFTLNGWGSGLCWTSQITSTGQAV